MVSSYKSNTIRIITVSGRIASGATTLAARLSKALGWRHIEGGEIFWEAVRKKLSLDPKQTDLRPDEEDVLFDEKLKHILEKDREIVLETKLAAFNSLGMKGVFRILVVCENEKGEDQTQIRIDRLANRDHNSVQQAKEEVLEREHNDLDKWRKLYAKGDEHWTYYDKSYYDLVINTYTLGAEEAFEEALKEFKKLEQVEH